MFLPVGEKQAGIAAAVPSASPSLSEDMQAVDEQVFFFIECNLNFERNNNHFLSFDIFTSPVVPLICIYSENGVILLCATHVIF